MRKLSVTFKDLWIVFSETKKEYLKCILSYFISKKYIWIKIKYNEYSIRTRETSWTHNEIHETENYKKQEDRLTFQSSQDQSTTPLTLTKNQSHIRTLICLSKSNPSKSPSLNKTWFLEIQIAKQIAIQKKENRLILNSTLIRKHKSNWCSSTESLTWETSTPNQTLMRLHTSIAIGQATEEQMDKIFLFLQTQKANQIDVLTKITSASQF